MFSKKGPSGYAKWRAFYRKRIIRALADARQLAARGRRGEAFERLNYAAGMRGIIAEHVQEQLTYAAGRKGGK